MQRIGLIWLAMVIGLIAAPATAQQTTPDQSVPAPAYVPPAPPPFPPMPSAGPSHRASGHHAARPKKHFARAHQRASKRHHHATKAHRRKVRGPIAKLHLSRRTIRQCHGMNYRRIIKHKYCRALMKQEIAEADRNHASHHHRASKHRHHRASKYRRH